MKKKYLCFDFQSMSVIMIDSNQLNKFWDARLHDIFRMTILSIKEPKPY
jgi:hypothetical protein